MQVLYEFLQDRITTNRFRLVECGFGSFAGVRIRSYWRSDSARKQHDNAPNKHDKTKTRFSGNSEVHETKVNEDFSSSSFVATRSSLEDMELETRALTEPLPTNQQVQCVVYQFLRYDP